MRSFAEDAAIVRRLAAEHFPSPERRRLMTALGEADARVCVEPPGRLDGRSVRAWAAAMGYPHAADRTWQEGFRKGLILLRMAASPGPAVAFADPSPEAGPCTS